MKKNRKRITWNILVAMSRMKIRRVVELQKRLSEIGIEISTQQLGRVVAAPPQRLNWELLEGLLSVLDCKLEELMVVYEEDPRTSSPDTASGSSDDTDIAPSKASPVKRAKTTLALGTDWGNVPKPQFNVLDPKPKG